MNELALKITNPLDGTELPAVQWNFEELKAALTDRLARYDGIVYTEDTVTDAKRDRATLNKVREAIDSERKRVKALYLAPYEKFEAEAKELAKMVVERSTAIDSQVKAYDEARKQEKQEKIVLAYREYIGDLSELVPLERLQSPKWLNVSVSLKTIETEMQDQISRIRAALTSISAMGSPFDMQLKAAYLERFDLADALAAKERLEKQAAAIERARAEQELKKAFTAQERPAAAAQTPPPAPVVEPQPEQRYTLDFRVKNVTKAQLDALKAFMLKNNINYGPVPKTEEMA